jgi:hypothetical protein
VNYFLTVQFAYVNYSGAYFNLNMSKVKYVSKVEFLNTGLSKKMDGI